MFGKHFMKSYVSFLTMSTSVAIVTPVYYFLTKHLARLTAEDCRQTVVKTLGVVAVGIAYQMMAAIEKGKDHIIEDVEKNE